MPAGRRPSTEKYFVKSRYLPSWPASNQSKNVITTTMKTTNMGPASHLATLGTFLIPSDPVSNGQNRVGSLISWRIAITGDHFITWQKQ
jgi:hypothetical protein